MALEANCHSRLDSGEEFSTVVADLLGTDSETPAAYLLIAVDLIISHWPKSRESAVPFLGCPDLLCIDQQRLVHDSFEMPDILGIRHLLEEPSGATSLAKLKQRPSRKNMLDSLLGNYVLDTLEELRESLRALLNDAASSLGPPGPNANLADPAFMVLYALNVTASSNWEQVIVEMKDGTTTRAFRYVPPKIEQEQLDRLQAERAEDQTDSSFERDVDVVLENPDRISAKFVQEALTWAQKKQIEPQIDDRDQRRMRNQAIVGVATIAARDGEVAFRAANTKWIRSTLLSALKEEPDPTCVVRGGIRFNLPAMAFVGIANLQRDESGEPADVRALLDIAASGDPSGAHGFAASGLVLNKLDGRLSKAILRCALEAAIYPPRRGRWMGDDEEEARKNDEDRRKARIASAVDAEVVWLAGEGAEPEWPQFPAVQARRKRGIRIGVDPFGNSREVEIEPEPTDWVNSQAAALWMRAASVLRVDRAPWLTDALDRYWDWTFGANGSGWARESDVDNPPRDWNQVYFETLATCLPNVNLLERALSSMRALPDESFFDILPIFLRAFDTVYFAENRLTDSEAARVRARLASRLSESYRWKRLRGDRSDGIETHIGPAIAVLFFNDFLPYGRPAKCYLFAPGIARIDGMVTTVADLAIASPCLFVALVTLNLFEVSPRASHAPALVAIARAWLDVYKDDTEFWIGHGIGKRFCVILEQSVPQDSSASDPAAWSGDLQIVLSGLIRLGVPEAAPLETLYSKGGH
jgi:hypothetical protein